MCVVKYRYCSTATSELSSLCSETIRKGSTPCANALFLIRPGSDFPNRLPAGVVHIYSMRGSQRHTQQALGKDKARRPTSAMLHCRSMYPDAISRVCLVIYGSANTTTSRRIKECTRQSSSLLRSSTYMDSTMSQPCDGGCGCFLFFPDTRKADDIAASQRLMRLLYTLVAQNSRGQFDQLQCSIPQRRYGAMRGVRPTQAMGQYALALTRLERSLG